MIAQGLAFTILGPILSRTLALENRDEAQSLISQSAVLSSFLGLSICAILAAFPGTYLGLFGVGFREATPILLILVATQMISILCGPAALILIMHRREKLVLFTALAGLGLNLGLKVMLIPGLGTIGAALATFAAVAVVKVALLALVIRETGFDPTIIAPIRRLFSK